MTQEPGHTLDEIITTLSGAHVLVAEQRQQDIPTLFFVQAVWYGMLTTTVSYLLIYVVFDGEITSTIHSLTIHV